MSYSSNSFEGWTPWKPPDYPIQDQHHNPWVVIDVSGITAYGVWLQMRPISEEDFREALRELKGQRNEDECVSSSMFATKVEHTSWQSFPPARKQ